MLVSDAVTRKTLPSFAISPNLDSFVYKLRPKWTKWNWDLEQGLVDPLSTQNPVIDKQDFGHAYARAFFPWHGIAELDKSMRNLSILIAQTLNATATAFKEQQGMIGQVLPNHRAPDMLAAQQGGTYALRGEECCFYINNQVKWYSNMRFWNKTFESLNRQDITLLFGFRLMFLAGCL